MRTSTSGAAVPQWVLAVGAIVVIAAAGIFVWRANAGPRLAGPASMQVRPGMYDFRAEAAAGRLGGGLKSMAGNGQ